MDNNPLVFYFRDPVMVSLSVFYFNKYDIERSECGKRTEKIIKCD